MMDRRLSHKATLERRIKLPSREIAVAVALTVAALAAIVATRFGAPEEQAAALSDPPRGIGAPVVGR